MSGISVEDLVKIYPGSTQPAVDGVNLAVNPGQVVGLLGPNGAGKSTLIGACTTRVRPTTGHVRIGSTDVATDPVAAKRRIGVMAQHNTLDRAVSVWENLYLHCRYFGIAARTARARANELLADFSLDDHRDALIPTLSGGQARRLQLARALAHSPTVVFLDEPTVGLDPQSRHLLWTLITELREHHVAVLLTTHYMDEADRLCNRIAIVDHGKLVALDTPEALKASVPGTNVIEAHFEHPPGDWEERLKALPEVTSVQNESGGMFRVLTANGSRTTTDLVGMAVEAGVALKTLTVQNTTLDDVFVFYTGRQLRDELVKAHAYTMPQRPGLQP